MATPIRFAPVLVGQEAEEFIERWQQTLKEPLQRPISQEDKDGYKRLMIDYEYRKRLSFS